MTYSVAQAARITRCTATQLRYWARTGLLEPTAPDGGYEFRDLVALRVIRSLLDTGLPTVRVRAALAAVRAAGGEMASLRIVTDGRRVWSCRDDGEILDALRGGQLALFIGVDEVAAEIAAAAGSFARERTAFVAHLVGG